MTQTERQLWMATLAKASLDFLEQRVADLEPLPEYRLVRPPEIGLAMVRGRAGGTGLVFNLGEMTVTRCAVQIEETIGFGYVGGRSRRHAELAAICDALLQLPNWYIKGQNAVIKPLQDEANRQKETQQRQTAATKVNFFTMLRGE